MKTILLLVLVLITLSQEKAEATSFVQLTEMEELMGADLAEWNRSNLVVVAKSQTGETTDYINVIDVLKGEVIKRRIDVGKIPESDYIRSWGKFRDAEEAIFFLYGWQNEDEEKFRIRQKWPVSKIGNVRELLSMQEDLNSWVQEYDSDEDVVYLLGELFKSYKFRSQDAPEIADYLNGYFGIWKKIGWGVSQEYKVAVTWDKETGTIKTDLSHDYEDTKMYITSILLPLGTYVDSKPLLKESFTLEVDFTKQDMVNGVKREDAVRYILKSMGSDKGLTKSEAFKAIQKMRAQEAVPKIIQMLDDIEQTPRGAIEILGRSKSLDVSEILRNVLENSAPKYGASYLFRAISQIEEDKGLNFYLWAVSKGLFESDFSIGHYGDENHFELLLNRYATEDTVGMSLYWLVARSNIEPEPWMYRSSHTYNAVPHDLEIWQSWWEENKRTFKVTKSFKRAWFDKHILLKYRN